MKTHAQVVVIGGGVVGASVLYHLTKARLARRRAGRARGTHLRLHLACGGRHAHGQRRPQRRQAAAIYDRALQGDRGDLRPVLRRASHRRHHAGRHARAARLAQDGPGPGPLPRHGPRTDLGRRGQEALPVHGREAFRRRHVRSRRRPCRPLWRHPRLCQGGADRRRHDRAPDAGSPTSSRGPTAAGTSSPSTAPSAPSTSSTPAASGPARSAAWSGSNCRCSPWSTNT